MKIIKITSDKALNDATEKLASLNLVKDKCTAALEVIKAAYNDDIVELSELIARVRRDGLDKIDKKHNRRYERHMKELSETIDAIEVQQKIINERVVDAVQRSIEKEDREAVESLIEEVSR